MENIVRNLLYPLVLSGALGLVSALSGCATNPVSGGSDFVLMSEQQELALGRKEHPNIVKKYGAYDDAALKQYVQRIGRQVAAKSHRGHLKFRFTLLDSNEVNAFALPGGYIYITRGLLAYLNSEAELAAVLGHEIGHVTARHSVRQLSAASATQIGMNIGAIFLPELRSQAAQDLLGTLGTALIRGYGRDHELEADRLGAEYLARSGYDSNAMIGVIRVLKNQELFEQQRAREENRQPRVYHGVFATHPDNDTRLQQVVAEAKKFDGRRVTRPANREGMLKLQDGLVFGNSAREGMIHDNAFYHRDLGIAMQFPTGWTLHNLSERLVAEAKDEQARFELALGKKPQKGTPKSALLKHFKIESLEQGEGLNHHGLQGYTGVTWLRLGLSRLRGRIGVIFKDDHAFYFAAVARDEKQFEKFDAKFVKTASSLHPIKEDERPLAEPQRIKLVKVKQGEHFAELARRTSLKHHAEEHLRLLNDKYPKGEPVPGNWIKIVK